MVRESMMDYLKTVISHHKGKHYGKYGHKHGGKYGHKHDGKYGHKHPGKYGHFP
jgi:hypothetical protein